MPNYNQVNHKDTNVHFSNAMFGQVERSRMTATPMHLTTFNAGDIVPIYCREVLPTEEVSIDLDFVIRQTTLLVPTMGSMKVDFYAFFVPNRIVNQSWKAVQGENYSGSWTANSVSLAPLAGNVTPSSVQIPVGSVADYYGFPTQKPLSKSLLQQCNDLKFRGYVMIYNEWFRDQNYQPPIPMSTLNVYQGFLDPDNTLIPLNGVTNEITLSPDTVPDGSVGEGSIAHSLYGSGHSSIYSGDIEEAAALNHFRATHKPLKANKLHDYFTTGLPSPQKSNSQVFVPVSGEISSRIPVGTSNNSLSGSQVPLSWRNSDGSDPVGNRNLSIAENNDTVGTSISSPSGQVAVYPSNLSTIPNATVDGLEVSLDDIRMSSAIQQVYETLGRGGSRYRELCQSFFGLEVDDPYSDIPQCLGHLSRDLDLFQTAQTSSSEAGGTAQGNLAAFGYTNSSGHLFNKTFLEHGYIHIFAIARHRNVYSSLLWVDNFRMNMLDFYLPPLANISEQPIYTRTINPFASNPNGVFAYQEAWAEYRYEPDMVSGEMRPMSDGTADGSLAVWNYADDFDSGLQIANGEWLKSNSESVLNRTLATTSEIAPQLKGQFRFIVNKTLPMPTYSVPGLDII